MPRERLNRSINSGTVNCWDSTTCFNFKSLTKSFVIKGKVVGDMLPASYWNFEASGLPFGNEKFWDNMGSGVTFQRLFQIFVRRDDRLLASGVQKAQYRLDLWP